MLPSFAGEGGAGRTGATGARFRFPGGSPGISHYHGLGHRAGREAATVRPRNFGRARVRTLACVSVSAGNAENSTLLISFILLRRSNARGAEYCAVV